MEQPNSTIFYLLATRSDINQSDIHTKVNGWVAAGRDRGSIDILWSSLLTIVLCVWVSTHPNALSPKDKWYHGVFDKLNLAMIGLLGPDFLFGLAVGQLSSARRNQSLCGGKKWTYTQAFFVDMGGIFLKSPDFPDGFPIDAEQLYYLVKHGFVDFPDMESMDISERNTVDTLSRLGDMMHLHPYGRPIKQELWDRFPSDLWRPLELMYYPLGGIFIVGFSASFMIGWNFHFPSPAEQLIWRLAASYHMFFSLYGAFHWLYEDQKWHRAQKRMQNAPLARQIADDEAQRQQGEPKEASSRPRGLIIRLMTLLRSQVNNSADKDPSMAVPLFVIIPNVLISALYAWCRMYFYVEDFVSLREQPKGIYLTGNRFLPFIGEMWK
ncbi:tannase subunit [Colletotrichum tofieldiae]|uniref:Tannase subunit n=1 Tax=Colletotrichum tofieldiae TaxID=708197 RepID=A0A161WIV3_9PEZI|nr:tannase subunit [Colletotrichum tofieldiae]